MTQTFRLIARLLLVMLICAAAPFSVGGERPLVTDAAPCAPTEAGEFDKCIDLGEPGGQRHSDATGSEPQAAEADAQECALLVDGSWRGVCTSTLAVNLAHLPATSPVLAALDRPPRSR